MDLKYVCQQYFTCMYFLGFIRYNKTFIACGFKKYYIITVFWWGKCVDLLTFEKHDIHFKSQLIHTFTESKDSNCFILYFEEIVVFWNKKKATRPLSCRSATCLLTSPCYYLNLYHLIYFLMFRPTKWQLLVLRTGDTSASTDHILFLYWRMRKWTTIFIGCLKYNISETNSMFQK
jgi:hypothetical protein